MRVLVGMARRARLVLPHAPHHVTQRGTRRMRVFFAESDAALYRELLRDAARRNGLAIWAYCLMPNHVHLIVAPADPGALARTFQVTHQRYAWRMHRREQWTGHLWQQRFYSCPLDEAHLLKAVRYVLLNPVRAGLVEHATDWPLSSLRCHLGGGRDELVDPGPLERRIDDWTALLQDPPSAAELDSIRRRTRYGRALPEADEDGE